MDEEAWRKLSEKERQRLLMEAKLLQRMLNKELYGSDWLRKIAELEGDEAALRELKRLQREKYEKMMRLKLLNRKRPQNKDDDLLIEIPTEWFDDPDEGRGRHFFLILKFLIQSRTSRKRLKKLRMNSALIGSRGRWTMLNGGK